MFSSDELIRFYNMQCYKSCKEQCHCIAQTFTNIVPKIINL